jgi:pyrroloquinoline quinone biosynthesis protein D
MITADSIPALRRGIKRKFDATRNAHVLLGPERVIVLDDIAAAILELMDGAHSVTAIAAALAARFAADHALVQSDVMAFVEELVEKGLASA